MPVVVATTILSLGLVSFASDGGLPAGSPITDPSYPMPAIGVGHDDDAIPALNTPTVLFINFEGPFMNAGCGDNSVEDCSTILGNTQIAEYPGDQADRATIVQAARADVLDFGVIVVEAMD